MQFSSPAGNTPRNGRTSPTVSVVIPTLNEERNLPHVFAALPEGIDEVVLVDGGSIDDTVAVARELRPDVVVVQQTRTGKGNALACGFAACTGDIIVMIDADGSTDPAEIPLFVDELVAGADFVKGSRFDKGGHSHDITPLRQLGNDGLNLVVNVLFGTRFTDLCYGYNAFWRRGRAGTGSARRPTLPRSADGTQAVGRRLRDRDDDQHPGRGRRHEGRRGRQRRARPHPRRDATSTPSATASGCCAPSSASTAGCAPSAAAPPRRVAPGRHAPPPWRRPPGPVNRTRRRRAHPPTRGRPAHVNRGFVHEVGIRRADDIKSAAGRAPPRTDRPPGPSPTACSRSSPVQPPRRPPVSIVIPTHTEERWASLVRTVACARPRSTPRPRSSWWSTTTRRSTAGPAATWPASPSWRTCTPRACPATATPAPSTPTPR